MFNLEESIAQWRRQMLAAGINFPVPLEELESHLRDDLERQTRSGLNAQQAFEVAVQKVGRPEVLQSEFRKSERKFMKRSSTILAALFGTVLGGSMILPALGMWWRKGVLHLWPLLAGSVLVIIAGSAVIYGVKAHREARGRKLISAFVIAAGSFYVVPLIQAFFMPNAGLADWVVCILLAAASVLFYGSCLHFVWRFPPPPIRES